MLDLDWRAVLWTDPAEYASCMRGAARLAGSCSGSDEEIAAAVGARRSGARCSRSGPHVVAQKHGPRGATVHARGLEPAEVPAHCGRRW